MSTKILIIFAGLMIIVLAIIGVRFITAEDNWLCQNGAWVKHGNPTEPQPTTPCPGAAVNQPVNNSNNNNIINTNTNSVVENKGGVLVTLPQANDLLTSPYQVEGEAAGWYFEATFPLKLLDASGKELVATTAQAQGDWMTGKYVPFKATLEFTVDKDQNGTLVLMNDNPSGLPELAQKVEIPVKLKANDTMTLKVFWGNSKKNPNAQDCRLVYAVERKVAKTTSTARAALTELLKGPSAEEISAGYYTSINSGVVIQKLSISNGLAAVDFSSQLEFQVGGSCRVAAINSQIVSTLKQFSTVKEVIISIDGRTEDILQP